LLLKASHIISKDASSIPPTAGGRGGVPRRPEQRSEMTSY